MASISSDETNKEPESESLKPRADDGTVAKEEETKANRHPINETDKKQHRSIYRPSHKATFVGLSVVIIILAINAAVLIFLLNSETAKNKAINDKGVSISPAVLSKLGVNSAQIGNSNEQLTVGPNALFNSGLTVAGNVKIGGQLHINSAFSASAANLNQLQASNSILKNLNVNGNTTESNLSLRGNLAVQGTATFQNTMTVGQILSVDNSAAIAHNLSVGGELTANTIATSNLILSGSFVFGSHIQTSGQSPSVGPGGGALGSNGTVSISGDDAAGTIAINIGTGATPGILARVAFHATYSSMPRIIITPVGIGANFYLIGTSTNGFSVAVTSGLPAGNYDINYIVEQ